MDPLDGFPYADQAVLERTSALTLNGDTVIPPDLSERMPFRLCYEFTGSDDVLNDYPTVSFDVFSPTYTEARDISERARQLLIATPWHVTVDGQVVVVDSVYTAQRPVEVPWGDTGVRRWTATYQMELRR